MLFLSKPLLSTPDSAHDCYANGLPPLGTYTYDKAGRNIALTHEKGNFISGHSYTLNLTGRRTAETFADGITSARTYGFDSMGNRTSQTYMAKSVNQYTTITSLTPLTHDANDNLLQLNGNFYTWDSDNRLLSIAPAMPTLGDKPLVHSYDGSHRRVTRTTHEWNAGGWNDLETTHFLDDGNVTEVTDHNGAPAATYHYDAFGNTLVSTGTQNRYRFSTKPLDSEVTSAPQLLRLPLLRRHNRPLVI